MLHHLPGDVDFIAGALTEPLACCVHAATEFTQISAGDLVLVTGDGAIGLSPDERRQLQTTWMWALPLDAVTALDLRRYAPGNFDMLAHPSFDAFWERFDVAARHGRFEVPAYHLTGWYDALLNGTLRNFAGLRAHAATDRARRNQRLIVGPWTHARPTTSTRRIGDVDYGEEAGFDSEALMVSWFRHWLGGATAAGDYPSPPVRLFVMGENRWRDEQEWLLARARSTTLHLASDGSANTAAGNGRLAWHLAEGAPTDTFTYDPHTPVPTGTAGAYSRAPTDQRDLERRGDVLVSQQRAARRATRGHRSVTLVLWGQFVGPRHRLHRTPVDVAPDGAARAFRRDPPPATAADEPLPNSLRPGVPTEFTIDVGATANVFLAGHRVRLEVSSSNFPRFDRNPNTGARSPPTRPSSRATDRVA
jgi:hypothetical protein